MFGNHRLLWMKPVRGWIWRVLLVLGISSVFITCSKKTSPNFPEPFPDLHVESTAPANSATGVAANAGIVVNFSGQIAAENLGIVLAPTPQNFYSSLQVDTGNRQVRSAITLSANTSYSLVIYSAADRFGDRLRTPFVSHFTTGGSLPAVTISGVSAAPFNEPTRGFAGLLRTSLQAVVESPSPDEDFYGNLAAVSDIRDTSGVFTISNVAPGTYWPFAALDVNRDGKFSLANGDRIQGYGADADAVADSVVVGAASLSSISLRVPVAGMRVLSTFPSNGSTSVPLQTTFRLTFTAPVDTNNLGLFVAPIPEGLTSSSLVLSADGRSLSAPVTLQANTSYTAVLYTARSTQGQMLVAPVQISFTTGAAFPAGQVRGRVQSRSGNVSPRNALVALLNTDFSTVVGMVFQNPGMATEVLRQTLVAISYVPEESGDFVILNVPDGTYWPASAKDANLNGSLEPLSDPLGYYDGDGNQTPTRADSVAVINGGLVQNVFIFLP